MRMFILYMKLVMHFVKNSLIREMQFRANFVLRMLSVLAGFIINLVLIFSINSKVSMIGSWTPNEVLFLFATDSIINAIVFGIFIGNMARLPGLVANGDLDYVLLRPIDSQFYVSWRIYNFGALLNVLFPIPFLFYSANRLEISLFSFKTFLYLFLILNSLVILYSILFMLVTTSIYFIRVSGIHEIFLTFTTLTKFPADVYLESVRIIFTFIVPVALISNIPARVFVRGFDAKLTLYSLALSFLFAILARLFWKWSLNYYSSASS